MNKVRVNWVQVRILGPAQIVPSPVGPGELETYLLARVLGDVPEELDRRISPVMLGPNVSEIPDVGTEVEVIIYPNFYRASPSHRVTRLVLCEFPVGKK